MRSRIPSCVRLFSGPNHRAGSLPLASIRFSPGRVLAVAGAFLATTNPLTASAQSANGAGMQVDPQTGTAYVAVRETVATPVVETRMVDRRQTTYTPRTVTETRPTTRTTFYPKTQTVLEPYVANAWNPFVRNSIAYRFVPRTHWQAQTDVVQQTTTRTEYVAETKTTKVPETVHRIEQRERIRHEPVGTVRSVQPSVSPDQAALAARLRPIGSDQRVVPLGQSPAVAARTTSSPRIASTSVAGTSRFAGNQTYSSLPYGQGGERATELVPRSNVYGQPLPPATSGLNVAGLPPLPIFR
ncbi:MAG: hypothetical protein AAF989_00650 [Planctomycetota bacterium]